MKKIIFAIPNLYGGGAERITAALCGFINTLEDYEVHLITYSRDLNYEYPLQSNIVWHNMDIDEKNALLRITKKISFMRSVIQSVNPICIISLAGPEMLALVALAARGLGVPLIFSERNDPVRYPTAKHLRILRTWAYKKSHAVVFQTTEAMSFFSNDIQKKGVVICNPLTQSLPKRFEGRRLPIIVTTCRLEPQKNLDLLIDSFYEVHQQFPKHTLYIYGEGSERARLEAKIREMGMSESILLPGYSNCIFDDIFQAALFVLPSNYEGISNSMLEAIALGVPTIATDCPVGGARETIIHQKNGILVPVGDKGKMVQAMLSVLSNEAFSEQLSQNGVKLREKLDISQIAAQWLQLVTQVARLP